STPLEKAATTPDGNTGTAQSGRRRRTPTSPRPEPGSDPPATSSPRALLAPELVGWLFRGDPDHPAPRIVRYAIGRPLLCRGQQRLLDRVLTRVEPAVPADQRTEDLRRLLAQHVLDAAGNHRAQPTTPPTSPPTPSGSGRTSTVSPIAATTRPAISSARSWLSTSTI